MLQTFQNDELQQLNPDQTPLSSNVDLKDEQPQELNIKNAGSSVTTGDPDPVTTDPVKKNPVNRGQAFNPNQQLQPESTVAQNAQGPTFFKDLYNKLDFTNTDVKNESDFTYKLLHDEEFRNEINGLLKVTEDNDSFTDAIYGQFNDYSGPYVDPDVELANNEDWLNNLPQAFEKFRSKLASPDAIVGGVPEWLQPKLTEGIDQIVQDPEDKDSFYIVGKTPNGTIGVAKAKNTDNQHWLLDVKDSLTNILVGTGASLVSTIAETMNFGYNEAHRSLYGSYDPNVPTPGLVDKLKQQYINANLPTSINYDKGLSPEDYAKLGLSEKFFNGLDEVFDSKYWIGGIGDQGAVSALEIFAESYILSRLGVKIPGLGKAGKAIDDVVGAGSQTFKRAGNWAATVGLYAAANTGLESFMEGRAKYQELYDRYKETYPTADENTIVEAARNGMLETMSLNVEAIAASNIFESALLHIPIGKIGNSFLEIAAKTPLSGGLEGLQELLQYGIGKYIDEKYKSLIPETTSHDKTLDEIGRLIDDGINNDKEAMDSFIAGAVLGAGMPALFDTKKAIDNEKYKYYNKNLIAIAHDQLYNGNSAMFKKATDSNGKPLTVFNKDAVASFDNFASSILKNHNLISETVDSSENFLEAKDDVQVLLTERMAMFLDNAIRREPELLKLSSDKLQEKLTKVILKETDFDKSDYRQLGFDKKLSFEDWNEMRHTALNTALNVFEQFGDTQNRVDHVGTLSNDPEFRDQVNTKINQNIYKLRAINAALATVRNNTFTTRDLDPNLTEDQIKENLADNEEVDNANKKIISKLDPKKYDKYTKLLKLNSNTIIGDSLLSLDKNKISELVKNLEEDWKRTQEESVKEEEQRQESFLANYLNKAKQASSNLSGKVKNYSLIERMFGKKKTVDTNNPSNTKSNEDINQTNSGTNSGQTSETTNTESIETTVDDSSTTTQTEDDSQDNPEEPTEGNETTSDTQDDGDQTIPNDEYRDNIRIPQIGDKLKSLAGGSIEIIGFNDLQQPIVLDNGEQYEITKEQFSQAIEKNILTYEEIDDTEDILTEEKYKEAIENHAAKYDKNSDISPVDYFDAVLKDINTNIKDPKIRERLQSLIESKTNELIKKMKVDDVLDMINNIIQNKNTKYQLITITPDGFVKYNNKTIPEEVEGYASSIAYTAREDKKLLDVKTNTVSFQHNDKYNYPQLKLLSSKHINVGDSFRIVGVDTNPVIYIPFADDFDIVDDTNISRIEKPLNEWFKDNDVRRMKISKDLFVEVTKEDFYDIQIQSLTADVKASLHIPTFFNRSNTSDELIADRIQQNLLFRRQALDLFNKTNENQIVIIPLTKRNYGPLNTIHVDNMGNQPITAKSIDNYDKLPVALYLNGELTYLSTSDIEGLNHLDRSSIDFSEIYNGRPVMLVDNGVGKIEPIPLRTPTIPENVQNVLLEIAESVISNKPMRNDLYEAFVKLDSKYRDLYNKDKNGNIRYFNFELFNELLELYVNPKTKTEKDVDPSVTGSFMRLDYDKNNKPIIKVKGFNRAKAKHFNQISEHKKYSQKELKDEIKLLRLSLNKSLIESNKELPTLHVSNETTVLVTYPYENYLRHNLKTYIEPIKIDSHTYTARINPILELGTPTIQDNATLVTSGVKPVSEQTVGQQDAVEPTVAFNSLQTFNNVVTSTSNDIEVKKVDIEKRIQEVENFINQDFFANSELLSNHWKTKKDLFENKIKQLKSLLQKGIKTGEDLRTLTNLLNDVRGILNEGININDKTAILTNEKNIQELANSLFSLISDNVIKDYIQVMNKAMESRVGSNAVEKMLVGYSDGSGYTIDGKNVEYFLSKETLENAKNNKQINAKYNAELESLNNQTTSEQQTQAEQQKADIERRRQEELNRVDKQSGERLDSKDAELRNKREAATRVLNGKDSKSYLESEQAQQDYDILGGNIYGGIVSGSLDSGYIKRAFTPHSEEVNAKYDAELAALSNSTTQVTTNELSDIINNLPLDNISSETTKKVKTSSALSILNDINPDEINPSMMEKTTEEILQNTKSLINFASPEIYGETQNKDC